MRAAATLLLPVALLLAACGQKGDLYVPSQEREVVPAAAGDDDEEGERVQPPAPDSTTEPVRP